MRSNLFPVAKEGWNYIFGSAAAFVVFKVFDLGILELISFLAVLFFVFVFRNPEREYMLYQEGSVTSPVDGKVVSIEEIDSDDGYAYRVDIEGSYFDVSLLRVPLMSSTLHVELKRGARLPSDSVLSKDINENAAVIFKDMKSSNTIKVIHRLKQSFAGTEVERIKTQNLIQGSRYGFMLNGITSVYLPQNFRLNVSNQSELRASESLLGYFMPETKK